MPIHNVGARDQLDAVIAGDNERVNTLEKGLTCLLRGSAWAKWAALLDTGTGIWLIKGA